ncbi:hypothetical protein M3Y95_00584300 [Aphelenchoides besseyi]|nr:hypothetical protein M3Y95_00584300 [Aphelenchoides besseyi]
MIVRYLIFLCLPFVMSQNEMPTISGSSLLIDWSREVPINLLVRQFLVDYDPPQGRPPTHSVFPPTTRMLLIEDATPAVDYSVNISALFTDGTRRPILSTRLVSSPPTPSLEFLKADTDEVTFALLTSAKLQLSFYIEYMDVAHEEQTNHIETNKSALRIRQLEPNTRYRLRIFSIFRGVPSAVPLLVEFKTRAVEQTTIDLRSPVLSSNESITQHRWPTLSPYGNLVTATVNYENNKEQNGGLIPPRIDYANRSPARPFYSFGNTTLPPHWKQPSSSHLSELPPLEAIGELVTSISSTPQTSTTTTLAPTSTSSTLTTTKEKEIFESATAIEQPLNVELSSSTTSMPLETEIDVGDVTVLPTVEDTSETTVQLIPTTTVSSEDIEEEEGSANPTDSTEIRVERAGQQIRIEWDPPEQALCDNFLVNTTITNLRPPQSFTTASGTPYSYIKFHAGRKLLLQISCMSEGAISTLWFAERTLDLTKPRPVENLRIKRIYTDEFYVSSVVLAIDWPRSHDPNRFEVVVVWSAGNKAVGDKRVVFNDTKELQIDKLEPTTVYTFAVRNTSKELNGLTSAPIGIRQTTREFVCWKYFMLTITAPIITSTLYAGQISSYAININFGESESEHKFDGYELVFAGNTRNITKKLGKNDAKSFTFNKLIPGRTYTFVLYTVYKNIRSRPVIEEITTYPLKVKSFYPVVGPGYVTLFWEIDNMSDNKCEFRLEYASTSNSGIRRAQKVELKDVTKYRFSGLDYDTYYTFTITVLMGRGKAQAESESEMVTIGFKSKPVSLPTLQRRGSRELLLTFENDPRIFSDTNGVVDNFAIIVSEDIKLGGDDYVLKSYYDVKDELHWPAYRASVSTYNPFKKRGSSRTTSFIVGEEDCDRRKLSEPYCNGVLRSHVDYYVKIRAYLVTNMAMETEWVTVNGLVDETPPEKGQRRLPCYMYLNGCSSISTSQYTLSLISLISSLITWFCFRQL